MPTTWPALPDTLLPDHAYGLLQVRENGRLRDSLLARVNLATRVVTPETYLSRTAYDWGYDDITFRAYKSTHVVAKPGETWEDFFSRKCADDPLLGEKGLAMLRSVKLEAALAIVPPDPEEGEEGPPVPPPSPRPRVRM